MKYFWPDIQDSKDANKACASASGASFFVAIITGVIAWLQMNGKINIFPGMSNLAYIDVALFIVIGLGIKFHSRIAALAGLFLFAGERAMMIKAYGFQPSQVTGIILFGLLFVNGVRGAFAWHEFKSLEKNQDVNALFAKEQAEPKKPSAFAVRPGIIILILFAVAGAGAYFYLNQHKEINPMGLLKKKINAPVKISVLPKKPMVAPEGPMMVLKLKNGRSFDGILTKKNSEGYWLYIEGMDVVYFSVSEVASVTEATK